MKIKSLTAAAVIALSSFGGLATAAPVSRTTYDLGTPVIGTPLSFDAYMAPDRTFEDFFTFSLPANSGVGFSVMNFKIGTMFDATLTGASLYSNADNLVGSADDTLIGTFSTGSGQISLASAALPISSYYLKVAGNSTGMFGGACNGAISVTAVPEPESYAMLLAGLGVMGVMVRRRKKLN